MGISPLSVYAVEGAAGCGKTHRLMEVLGGELGDRRMSEGQRVLALTFMHGARLRLQERLRSVETLRDRVNCITIDSLAWKLRRRWRALSAAIGLPEIQEDDFDGECKQAGALLERDEVQAWIGNSYPIVLIDEGQDLKPQRLRMVQALGRVSRLLIAADEFQCLDPELRPNPLMSWLRTAVEVRMLTGVRRTDNVQLIGAARAIREGRRPVSGGKFRVLPAVSVPMASAYLANAIAWSGGGSVAVITPSMKGGFARNVVARVCAQPCGKYRNGPYGIAWEKPLLEELLPIVAEFPEKERLTFQEANAALGALPKRGAVAQTLSWLYEQHHALGRDEFLREHLVRKILRMQEVLRTHAPITRGLIAMTVAQAKNREFDGVVVVWPYQVGGDAEHKRRLLYNAVTRARRWCTVLVQGGRLPTVAPFGG